jgi:pimeloyl-ACP methyl ester carboxylesterase
MTNVSANNIRIEYETFGDPSAPALLLIIGLGGQLIEWHEKFCRRLVERGHYVIRFDNRDAGLSTKFEQAGLPNLTEMANAVLRGEPITAPYSIADMADDAVGLLDALGIDKAHVCGMSMGGMIAQTVAVKHPGRVLSLISIYSTTGNPELPQPRPEAMEVLLTPPPSERDAYIEHTVNVFRTIAGSGFPFDREFHRNLAARSYDRAFYPQGATRQLMAIVSQENRKPALGSVTVPTLVIHGSDDPLVPVECGRDTADAIPGAELLIIEGMGHDLPPAGAWPRIVEAIAEHTRKAEWA